jgi:1,2-phenylacetyl-CoA epoxidase catalytic subunit
MVIRYSKGTPLQRKMIQDSIKPLVGDPPLMMFGPHDSESSNSEVPAPLGRQNQKPTTKLRTTYVNQIVPRTARPRPLRS